LSMRWWLAIVFAAIVALTAISVGEILTVRSQQAFRARAHDLAAGAAVTAAAAITKAEPADGLEPATTSIVAKSRIAVFLFDGSGKLLTAPRSNGVMLKAVPDLRAAIDTALAGHRSVTSESGGRRIVVALPMRTGNAAALVAVVSRPDLVAAGNILRGQRVWAIVVAIILGALIGVVVAILITSRLRRIARAAKLIAGGRFGEPLVPGFRDELGELASTVDEMRLRLRDSFASVEQERDRLRSLLEQLQEAVIAVDRELKVVFANSRAELWFGRRLMQPGCDLPDPWPKPSLRRMAAALVVPDANLANIRVTAGEKRYSVVGIPLRALGDSALLVVSDVTAADRRERAEREFVTNAAHELRTPLTAIAAAVEALESGAGADREVRDRFVRVIGRQSSRLGRLVRSLLVLARAQTGAERIHLEPVALKGFMEALASEVGEGATRIEVVCDPALVAQTHPDLLAQAVGNLVSNALKYGNGERIVLRATRDADDCVRIEVRDYGPGISDPVRERVFDRFFRDSDDDLDGFGLGLAIVREIAAVLGGSVELDAPGGVGTEASITLPAARAD
jgi:signal transduction histidine kinase